MSTRCMFGVWRRLLVTRALAAFIVVLAAMPFTAPFSAFDVAECAGKSFQTDEGSKATEDPVDLVRAVPQTAGPSTAHVLVVTSAPAYQQHGFLLSLILRV